MTPDESERVISERIEWAGMSLVDAYKCGTGVKSNRSDLNRLKDQYMNESPISPEEVIAAIDDGFNRMPIRTEGVHWLKAWEWDAIKAELSRRRSR